MGIVDKAKDLYGMNKQAKAMKKKMEKQEIVGEANNKKVKLYMNAAQELNDVYIDEEWFENASAKDVSKAIKKAFKDYQKKLQKVMMNSFDMDQLKDMLGK
jgi:DNA phosphorothioation-dependent restriction protein DptG